MSTIVGVTALAAVTLSGCSIGAKVEEDKTFSFSGKALAIELENTDLTVRVGNGSDIKAKRKLNGKAAESGQSIWELNGEKLKLTADCNGFVMNCGGRYELEIPKNVAVKVTGETDDIDISGITQETDLRTTTGDIKAQNISGNLSINVTTGRVEGVDLRSAQVTAESSTGDTELVFVAAPTKVDAKTSTGDLSIRVPAGEKYQVRTDSSTGSRDSTIPDDKASNRSISARTSTGDVSITTS